MFAGGDNGFIRDRTKRRQLQTLRLSAQVFESAQMNEKFKKIRDLQMFECREKDFLKKFK